MYLDWTKHLTTKEEKDEFEKEVLGSRRVIERLSNIIKEYERALSHSETDPRAYDTPNWAEKQAHKNGYRSCLVKMQELLNLDRRIVTLD